MEVLLLSPAQGKIYGKFMLPSYPHLGLAYLAAVLENAGHGVKIIEADADRLTAEKLIAELKAKPYGVVGVTATTPTFHNAVELAGIVKNHSSAKTVLGGIHPTILPEESLAPEAVDFVVKGEGEETFLELVNFLEAGQDVSAIDGLYYKVAGAPRHNKERQLIADLDRLPFPAWGYFNSLNCAYPDSLYVPTMPIITSRGCPAACTFCTAKSIFARRFRARSPQNIVQEIELLINKYRAKEIHIWDDNFITQKARVLELSAEIKRRKIKMKFAFPNGLRADYVDKEILAALKGMGVYSVAFGVESGNQRVLDKVNKNITLAQIEEAFRLAKECGLETWGFFMIGLPGDDAASINDTIEFAIKLDPDVAKFHILKPFPTTPIYEEFLKQGLLLDSNLDHFSFHMPPVHRLEKVSREELLSWHKLAYRRFYLRPRIFLKQACRLRSWHRARLNIAAAVGVLENMW